MNFAKQPQLIVCRAVLLLWFITLDAVSFAEDPTPMAVKHFSDSSGWTQQWYGEDLESRFADYARKTGVSVHIIVTNEESLENLAWAYFHANKMEKRGANGTVVVVVSLQMRRIDVASSENFRAKFDNSRTQRSLDILARGDKKDFHYYIERLLHRILEIMDPWFYVLDPPGGQTVRGPSLAHSPIGEFIMFPLAPILGFALGVGLMAFTSAGGAGPWARAFACGWFGAVVSAAAAMLVVRQPGGLIPGMLYYSIGAAFVTGASVGALRNFWFPDHYRGRMPKEPGPLYFRWG